MLPPSTRSSLFPYTTLFRSLDQDFILQADATAGDGSAKPSETCTVAVDVLHLKSEGHFFSRHGAGFRGDRKSTRLNSSHVAISYAVFCLKKKIIIFFVLALY